MRSAYARHHINLSSTQFRLSWWQFSCVLLTIQFNRYWVRAFASLYSFVAINLFRQFDSANLLAYNRHFGIEFVCVEENGWNCKLTKNSPLNNCTTANDGKIIHFAWQKIKHTQFTWQMIHWIQYSSVQTYSAFDAPDGLITKVFNCCCSPNSYLHRVWFCKRNQHPETMK